MPWSIPAYRVSPADTIPIFQACKEQGLLTTGVGTGMDLAYWSQAVRFGAALVARQRFLPGTIHDADGARAAWAPLFIGADAERLARLSQRMPAAARALSYSDAGHRPTSRRPLSSGPSSPRSPTAWSEFPTALRRWRRPGAAAKEPTFDSVHDAWLDSLRSGNGQYTALRATGAAVGRR